MFTLFWFLFFCNNVNSFFYPTRMLLQKKTFTCCTTHTHETISINDNDNDNTTIYNNTSTVQIQQFVEYMKLKTFEYNEMEELWDSGEIEWEF